MHRPRLHIVPVALSLILFPLGLAAGNARIHYTVSVDPVSETFSVTADLHDLKSDTMTFFFPVWAPGAYDIVNFGAFVDGMIADGGNGRKLEVIRADTNTFRIVAPTDHVRLSYRVDDIEYLDNSAWFSLSDIEDSTAYAFAVGTALFGYPEGRTEIPYTVTYTPPSGWNLAVALDPVPGKENTFAADNYDELVDAPLQMGKFQRAEFKVNGIPHIVTMTAPVALQDETMDELVRVTKDVVETLSEFFGEMPYERYLFQFYLKVPDRTDMGYGALEHANSSTYLMPFYREDLITDMLQPVISHEYWHLWSPKRFHVDKLGPFDYQHGPRTTSLWFHEGLTEYYARLLLVRNDLRSSRDFLHTFGSFVEELYGRTQSEPITVLSEELTERPLMEIISLYTKGPLLGLLLDAEIRLQTGNRKSLDDAMKYFNVHYGDHRGGKDFGDDDIIPIIETATGAELDEFHDRYISGTEAIPFDEMLLRIGLRPVLVPDFGARLAVTSDGWRVATVYRQGMAAAGGLQKDDLITGIGVQEGEPQSVKDLGITPLKLSAWLGERTDRNGRVTVRYLRNGEPQTVTMDVHRVFKGLEPDGGASKEAIEIRKSMFGF